MKCACFRAWVVVVSLLCAASLRAQQADLVQQTSTGTDQASVMKVPRLVRFSGGLKDLAGKPLAGPVDVHFAIYKEQTDVAPIWQETQTLQLDEQGRYTVLLGAMSPEGLPLELFTSGEARWLGVAVGNLPEQPRVLLVSVPYALKAGDAETLGGKPASAFVMAEPETTVGQVAALGTASGGSGKASASQATQVNNLNATILGVFPASPLQPDPAHGVREFLANGSFRVPAGITQLMVEMWGGGGGGAGLSNSCGRGGGGGGAYTRDVITVVPRATYTIVVGAGGAVGKPPMLGGGNGGDSQIEDRSHKVLTFAGGGHGGSSTADGAGGKADPKAAISHSGYAAFNGNGSWPPADNLKPDYASFSGHGGYCGLVGVPGGELHAEPGGSGYVLLGW